MDHLVRAAETLWKAEAELRDIAASAATEGDYAGVVQIASWAKTIRDLLERKPAGGMSGNALSTANGTATPIMQVKRRRTPQQKSSRTSQQKNGDNYPRFFRRGEELVRVAWSRRARSEYQHKTSGAVLKSMTSTLAHLGRKGRVFSTDEVLPLRDEHGAEVPAYQAYVCIGLLKMTGLIEQHGRQGYSISSPDEFTGAVDAIWRKLPSK